MLREIGGMLEIILRGCISCYRADTPDSFVLATNRTTLLEIFVKMAFSAVDIDIEFRVRGKMRLEWIVKMERL